MVSVDRRYNDRVPFKIFINEYVSERLHRAVTTNLSPTGLYVHRVFGAGHRHLQFGRDDRSVQLEFELPGTRDTIWARGEIRYDDLGLGRAARGTKEAMVHGTGIHLVDIARGHARLLRDFVFDYKRRRLERILDLIRRNRYH